MLVDSALLIDQYELVMAHGYWKLGMAEQRAVFQLSFRSNPFESDYAIACGLSDVIRYLSTYRFTEEDIRYLDSLELFDSAFLDYLSHLEFTCDVDAIVEGNLVFAQEPLLRIEGPLLQCQLLETAMINLMNFPTLLATKANLIFQAAKGDSVVEFGVRRAQGPNGGLTASRAAYIGGCDSTSHVLAGKEFGIPIKGTLAHSWVMAFPNELEAFQQFADVQKTNPVLLVDTYDTISGMNHAIEIGQKLRQQGKDLLGIRLDSGDIAKLSIVARKMLDKAGFEHTMIMASGDLDDHLIQKMKKRGAKVDAWGVGTKLSTCFEQPALNMIYKLTAIQNAKGLWDYKLKVSDEPKKQTMAGRLQIRRYQQQHQLIKDVIYDLDLGITDALPKDADQSIDVLQPIFRQGKCVYQQPSIHDIRASAIKHSQDFQQQKKLPGVELEPTLKKLQKSLIEQHK